MAGVHQHAHYGTRALMVLAWPVVVARSTQAVVGFCDAIMSAPLGEAALAAVTTGAMNTFSAIILPMGMAFIVQSFAAQLFGKGDLATARAYGWQGLILAAIAGVIGALAIPFIGDGLALLDYEPDVHRHMTDYMEIRLLAVGAAVGVEVIGAWYGGLGNTRLHMLAGIIIMVVNVFGNWVLIGGNLGAPALGVEGAAYASALSSWVGFGVVLWIFVRRRQLPAPIPSSVPLRYEQMGRIVRFGLPSGLNWFLEFAAFAAFVNVVIGGLGTTVLAAMMAVLSINSVSFMPAFGLSSAGAILVGQAIGAGHKDEVPGVVRRTLAVTATWQGFVGLFYLLIPTTLMAWFAPEDSTSPDLLRVGAALLMVSAAWQLFDAFAMVFSESLRGAGDTAWPMWARILLAWLAFMPASFIGVKVLGGGYLTAMVCVAGYIALLAVALVWRFRTGAWRHIDLTGQGELPEAL